MRIVTRRCAAACFIAALALLAHAAHARGGRIRSDSVRAWLAALREPVEQPQNQPAGWSTAYGCLRKIRPDDRVVLPELIAALEDNNPRIQEIAAEAIGNIGPEARVAVADLRGLLRETGESRAGSVPCAVATALGQIGDDAIDAADDLVWAFRGPADYRAREALLRLGGHAVPAVIRGLKDPNANVRERCVALLPLLESAESLDWDLVLELLGDQAESQSHCGCCVFITPVGRSAAASLAKGGVEVVPRLRKGLDSSNPYVRMR